MNLKSIVNPTGIKWTFVFKFKLFIFLGSYISTYSFSIYGVPELRNFFLWICNFFLINVFFSHKMVLNIARFPLNILFIFKMLRVLWYIDMWKHIWFCEVQGQCQTSPKNSTRSLPTPFRTIVRIYSKKTVLSIYT